MTVDAGTGERPLHRLSRWRLQPDGADQRGRDDRRRPGPGISAYLGGRDDAFFNDLPGFFRSINYAPQFYNVPQAWQDVRELPIPKTLLELEGNTCSTSTPRTRGTATA